ncbi:MAG: L,D-transpeptidase family protein [Acidobacteriota bacterium]
MNKRNKQWFVVPLTAIVLTVGCTPLNTLNTNSSPPPANQNANATPSLQTNAGSVTMFTLPMLRAFFDNRNFTAELSNRLGLSVDQISQLQKLARDSRNLNAEEEAGDSTYAARQEAREKIAAIIGEQKTAQLAVIVDEYWHGKPTAANGATNADGTTDSASWNIIPTDTRIVVNAPAYRMDIFENGQLVKSFKVGVGYPEFPLPTGLRQAQAIIFNPSWVPPDEPWVESSTRVRPGEKVEAGDKLNPLGIAKIPIGLPSLIHGGKAAAKIGGFASHGCIGLTDAQMREFIQEIARISNTNITAQDIAEYGKRRTQTQEVKLTVPVPVELRYETILVENGNLHIYRDIYDMDTNTEANLRMVLGKYGVTVEDLSEAEQTQILKALKDMSRDASGKLDNDKRGVNASQSNANRKTDKPKAKSAKVTRTVKGAKEVVIDIAALVGKGYPEPIASVGRKIKSSKSLTSRK